MSAMVDSLREVPLFAEVSDRDLRRLAESMHERTYDAGQDVMSEGQSGVGFFVVLDGTAQVSVGGEARGSLGPGDHFGEMALLEATQRTATVTAGEGLRCAAMTAWTFRPFVKDHPDVAWALLKSLARRVREAQAPRAQV